MRVQSCASTRFVAALAILPRWKANIITHEHQREREKSKTNFSCNKLETQICITALDAFYAAHLQPHSPPLSSPSPPSLHPCLPTAQHSSINLWPYFYALHTLTGCCFSGEFSFQPAVHTKDCLCFARFASISTPCGFRFACFRSRKAATAGWQLNSYAHDFSWVCVIDRFGVVVACSVDVCVKLFACKFGPAWGGIVLNLPIENDLFKSKRGLVRLYVP